MREPYQQAPHKHFRLLLALRCRPQADQVFLPHRSRVTMMMMISILIKKSKHTHKMIIHISLLAVGSQSVILVAT